MIPQNKPKLSRFEIEQLDILRDQVMVVGIRGYYLNGMGEFGKNDRGIYDDAAFIISPTEFESFNFNTDPSKYRIGSGIGINKGMALLNPGLWKAHTLDYHRGQYLALCQRASKVTVTRDGNPPYEDTGWFGINIHKGGNYGTSSLGCQTVPKDQWDDFIGLVEQEMKRLGQTICPYLLIDEKTRR